MGRRETVARSIFQTTSNTMSNINLNCDGSHCRHGYEVRVYPLGSGGDLWLCLPCFANENMNRYMRAKQAGHPEDSTQVSWATAEVIYDKDGKPFDAKAAVRKWITDYYQNDDGQIGE
jgi:hypothetical protein